MAKKHRKGEKMVSRNEPCSCGSGLKFKKCCLNKKESEIKPFVLEQTVYERDFLPMYDNESNLNTMLIVELVLPFYIPLAEGRTITMEIENEYYSFQFNMVNTQENHRYFFEDKKNAILERQYSKVVMFAAIPLEYDEILKEEKEYYSIYFDCLIHVLNGVITSYMISQQDSECHYLTREMLPVAVPMSIINLNSEEWEINFNLLILHSYAPYQKNVLNTDELEKFLNHQSIVFSGINPFVAGEQHFHFSRRYLKNGFYHEALMYIQISLEVFIRKVFEEILREKNDKSEAEIFEIIEDTSFMSIIKKINQYLGGNWDIKNDNTPSGNWYINTYKLRNKAVHAGYIPSFEEVELAISASIRFKKFILDRVKQNKNQYPNLNKYLL